MEIAKGIYYVGVSDKDLDLFEGQFAVPDGMAYNSYVVCDEKIAVMDTVEASCGEEWLKNVKEVLGSRRPDYLIVHHMEPDHSANIGAFMAEYPETKIAASAAAFNMMRCYFGTDYPENKIVVGEGYKLSLGKKELTFITAPMVHWPEVVLSYESESKTLFSADAFGKFGAFDVDDEWACEARRYYFGIVGKYGAQVQALLKKTAAVQIERICPLHGPVLDSNIPYYIDMYDTWSSYGVESQGVVIAYTSVYGHTKQAAELLSKKLEEKGCPKVSVTDLARDDMAEAVEDAFRYGKLVLATTTYNADVFPYMKTFIEALKERNYSKRTVGFIENGSWALTAAKVMRSLLEECKDITFCQNAVHVKGALNEANEREIELLAEELL